jgi:hypothetical protein
MFKILVMGMGVKTCVEHLSHVFIFILAIKLGCGCVSVMLLGSSFSSNQHSPPM